MSAIILQLESDVQGNTVYGPPFTTVNMAVVLTANVAQSITVPNNFNSWYAVFSYFNAAVFIALNDTAEIPTGTFSNTTSQLLPAVRYVKAGDTLSFISNTSSYVGVSFYGKQ